METREQLSQRIRREQQLKARRRLAATRRADAEQERLWAIVAAHRAGLSLRPLAAASGRSRRRIHQLLQEKEAWESPTWLTHWRDGVRASECEAEMRLPTALAVMQARLADEVEVLRWCLDWLTRLERGEQGVVNLRPETEDATEYVLFDQARVRRVLARIAADLDTLARHDVDAESACAEPTIDPRTQHRRRLAEPEEQPRRSRTAQEQREALRKAFGLPPYSGDYADYFRHLQETKPE